MSLRIDNKEETSVGGMENEEDLTVVNANNKEHLSIVMDGNEKGAWALSPWWRKRPSTPGLF